MSVIEALDYKIEKLEAELEQTKLLLSVAKDLITEAIEPDFELDESWIGRAGELGVEQCY